MEEDHTEIVLLILAVMWFIFYRGWGNGRQFFFYALKVSLR